MARWLFLRAMTNDLLTNTALMYILKIRDLTAGVCSPQLATCVVVPAVLCLVLELTFSQSELPRA